jgi:hypothetical protein
MTPQLTSATYTNNILTVFGDEFADTVIIEDEHSVGAESLGPL